MTRRCHRGKFPPLLSITSSARAEGQRHYCDESRWKVSVRCELSGTGTQHSHQLPASLEHWNLVTSNLCHHDHCRRFFSSLAVALLWPMSFVWVSHSNSDCMRYLKNSLGSPFLVVVPPCKIGSDEDVRWPGVPDDCIPGGGARCWWHHYRSGEASIAP